MPSPLASALMAAPAASNPLTSAVAFGRLPAAQQMQVRQIVPEVQAAGMTVGMHVYGGTALHNPVNNTMSAATIAQLAAAAAPSAPASGTGQGTPPGQPWTGPSGPQNPLYAGWEADGVVNPVAALARKPYPIHILPGVQASDATGAATITFTPQEDFQAFLLTFPSTVDTSGYLTALSVGTRLIGVNPGTKVPLEVFSEKTDGRRFDFPFAKATQQIVATITGGPTSVNLYACLLGYAPLPARIAANMNAMHQARMGYVGLGSTTVPIAGSSTINIVPQEIFKLRRMLLNSSATNFANLIITGLVVGTNMQTSQNANFPASLFSELAIDDWIDFDVCPATTTIAITVSNTNTSQSAVFEGAGVGDVWYGNEARFAA